MPLIRCKWYDPVDGTPIRGGCRRGADCEFVHPSHLRWNDAPPLRNSFNSFNGPKRTSSNTLELGRRTSGLTSWGVPRDSGSTNDRSKDNDAFASDGFNQPESSRGGGRNSNSNRTWGVSSSKQANVDRTTNENTSSSSGWGWGTSNDTSSGGGWGDAATDNVGWGDSTGGWGTSSSNPEASGSGSSSSPAKPTETTGSGSSKPGETPAWGSTSTSTSTSTSAWGAPAASTKADQSAAWPATSGSSVNATTVPASSTAQAQSSGSTWGAPPAVPSKGDSGSNGWKPRPAPINTESASAWGSNISNPSPSRSSPRPSSALAPQSPPPPTPPMDVGPPPEAWRASSPEPVPMDIDDSEETREETRTIPVPILEVRTSHVPPAPLFDHVSEDSEEDVSRMLDERLSSVRPASPSAESVMSIGDADDGEPGGKWKTYIKLVAQAVQRCKQVRETYEKYQKSNNTANSKFYKSLEEGSRAHMILTKTAHKDKERYELAKKRLNESIKELVELEYPTAGSGLSEEDYVRAQENEKAVRELAEWIDSVRPIVQELSRNAPTAAGHSNSKNAAGQISSSSSSSSSKSSAPSHGSNFNTTANDTLNSNSPMDMLQARIAKLDAKVDDLEEYFHSAVFDHKDEEYHQLIEEKMEEARRIVEDGEAQGVETRARAVWEAEKEWEPVIERHEEEAKVFGSQLATLREDITKVPNLASVREQQDQLLRENEELKRAIATHTTANVNIRSSVTAQHSELETLKAQFAQLQSRPPPPPPPTLHDIARHLTPHILEACRSDIAELLKNMHRGVEHSLSGIQANLVGEVYKGLWPVMGLMDKLQTFAENENALAKANANANAGVNANVGGAGPGGFIGALPTGVPHPTHPAPPS